MPSIYKLTFPNGKIYVGQDRNDAINYYGSFNHNIVKADFTEEELDDFSIRKTILWKTQDTDISNTLLSQKEAQFIGELNSYDPDIGYNRLGASIPYTYVNPTGLMYYFRRNVQIIDKRYEIRFSLETKCPDEALIRSRIALKHSWDVIGLMQNGLSLSSVDMRKLIKNRLMKEIKE